MVRVKVVIADLNALVAALIQLPKAMANSSSAINCMIVTQLVLKLPWDSERPASSDYDSWRLLGLKIAGELARAFLMLVALTVLLLVFLDGKGQQQPL
jgi:hypothetical protein